MTWTSGWFLLAWLAVSFLPSSSAPSSASCCGAMPSSAGSSEATTSTPAKPKNTWEQWASRLTGADPLLLQSICEYETRGERSRGVEDRARSRAGALGRCQVKPGTAAYHMGLTADTVTPDHLRGIKARLRTPGYGALHAGIELAACERKHPRSTARAVYCYAEGRWASWDGRATEYTKNVLLRYAVARLREQRT